MLAFLLALNIAAAQTATTVLDSATLAFVRTNTMIGEVNAQQPDIMQIKVTDPNVRQLRFNLKNISGDSDLLVTSSKGGIEQSWNARKLGNEELIIRNNDPKIIAFNDGMGLQRMFTARVFVTAGFARYELTVTAEYTYTSLLVETPMDELVKAGETMEVMQILPVPHDLTMLSTESFFWQWTILAAAGIGLGAAAWIVALSSSQKTNTINYVSL